MIFKFKQNYFYLTIFLFLIEVLIAVFIKDTFIRPFVGDILVVILIYTFIQAFVVIKPVIAAISVFIFACIVEILQYFQLVNLLGLQNNKIMVVVLGSVFDWKDIFAYAIGTGIIVFWERRR